MWGRDGRELESHALWVQNTPASLLLVGRLFDLGKSAVDVGVLALTLQSNLGSLRHQALLNLLRHRNHPLLQA